MGITQTSLDWAWRFNKPRLTRRRWKVLFNSQQAFSIFEKERINRRPPDNVASECFTSLSCSNGKLKKRTELLFYYRTHKQKRIRLDGAYTNTCNSNPYKACIPAQYDAWQSYLVEDLPFSSVHRKTIRRQFSKHSTLETVEEKQRFWCPKTAFTFVNGRLKRREKKRVDGA